MSFRAPVRVKQTSVTTGVGTLTLIAAASQFQGFAAVFGAGPVKVFYAISGTSYFEVGIGTWTSGGPTLSRDTVLASSNAGAPVSLPTATHDVFAWSAASWPAQVVTGTATLALADLFGLILYTGAAGTLNLPAIATLPAGIAFPVIHLGTGALTLDPNAAETMGGAATVVLQPGESGWIFTRDTVEWEAIISRLMAHKRNAQTGTSYPIVVADRGSHITRANAAAMTDTIAQAGSAGGPPDGWFALYENIGPAPSTVTPATSTINGAASLQFLAGQWGIITADAGNYRCLLGSAASITAKFPLKYLGGLELSRPSTTTFGIAAGACANEDGGTQFDMTLAAAITKSTSAWAAGSGNGGLDTGAIAASTWYHVHLIRKTLDGSIDALYSLSATSPTMPSGYVARRRLGSIHTDGASLFELFSHVGDEFLWDAVVIDLNTVSVPNTAVLRTLTVPTGVVVTAIFDGGLYTAATDAIGVNFSSPATSDQASQSSATSSLTLPFSVGGKQAGSSPGWYMSHQRLRTNTSAQIRSRQSIAGGATDRLGIVTRGWIDTRGK